MQLRHLARGSVRACGPRERAGRCSSRLELLEAVVERAPGLALRRAPRSIQAGLHAQREPANRQRETPPPERGGRHASPPAAAVVGRTHLFPSVLIFSIRPAREGS